MIWPVFLWPALLSGAAIGVVLGLVGGGGSILAVPLLSHVVGVPSAHHAIGTAAVAVALNAAANLVSQARTGLVKWRCGLVFAAGGVVGALGGAEAGKAMDGERLLLLFGLLMIGVGAAMLRKRKTAAHPDVRLTRESAGHLLPRLLPAGVVVGGLSGFFGIGGGFLIVPALMAATAMPLRNAIATSLLAVTALGLTTASSYAVSGFVEWGLAGWLVLGGVVGGIAGVMLGQRLAAHKRVLDIGFALLVITVGAYVVYRALAVVAG